ncbi:unnamed protein product [Coregonus sp. 'balchen']|nr:unnamed protein product [Coregonus sp. 'balchen']
MLKCVCLTGPATNERSGRDEGAGDPAKAPQQQGSPKSEDWGLRSMTGKSDFLAIAPPPPLTTYEYPTLPITKNRLELISLIENNSMVIIRGATGCGKTTLLPQFILDYYSEKNAPCNLVVTQPRKIGASSIARWVARECKCTLGGLVGYQVGLEKMATEHTRLIYMTTGVLLQKLVEGAPYAIEEFYLDDLHSLIPYRVDTRRPDDPYITVEMYNVTVSLIQSFDELEAKDQREGGLSLPDRGSVLVFLPGLGEIHYMQEALSKLVRKRLQVYPLHSSVTLEEQNGVFLVPVPGYRKIILSTNISESSVTVPDVKYVIDFCLARHMVCDKETRYQSLRLTWASKTNCNQRRAVTERGVKPFDEVCVCAVDGLFGWKMGALSVGNDGQGQRRFDGELTFLGRILPHLPVDLHLGKMIVLGHFFGCLEECLIIAASLSLKSFFAVSFLQQLAGYKSKLLFAHGVPRQPGVGQGELHLDQEDQRGIETSISRNTHQVTQIPDLTLPLCDPQVAELYEDLKERVSQFNMHVIENPAPMDYSSLHKQRFIQQCGQVKSIAFDGSRGHVEFYRTTTRGSGLLPEVSLALLLAHQRHPLDLFVHPSDEVETRAGSRTICHMRCARVNVDFQNNSVYPVGVLSSTIDPDKLPSNPIFPVNITEVVEVDHFWGFKAGEASMEKQRHLTAEINSHELCPVPVSLYPNLLCLAPFAEGDEQGLYYRAKILHVRGSSVEAQEFWISGMHPLAQSMILGDQWSSRARNRFITVADIMIQVGHAIKAEESFESKQIHDVLVSLNKDLQDSTYTPNATSSSWKTSKEEKQLIDSLLQSFAKTSQFVCMAHPVLTKSNFHSFSNVTDYRSVLIEKDRINSVALNDSARILLKETTLMPHIHGLPALITMLFTPAIELRTNEERTSYTGALCGLGWNVQSQPAVLPEHDMELAFVKFDCVLCWINALRGAINRLVCEGPNGPLHLGPDRIKSLQEDCRERLISLFTKSPPREDLVPVYHEEPKQWNQVDPSQKMEIFQKEGVKSKEVLFQLLNTAQHMSPF